MIKHKRVKYSSYGNYYHTEANVFFPETIEELKDIILLAKEQHRKITIAGSFHSFDNQNSGNDMVVSLQKIDHIDFNPIEKTIEVGPGVNWGRILKVAYKNYCVPFICITGSKPTAGGTLSAHANSVFSPSLGKEGNHCMELDLLTTEGQVITCSRTENAPIFYGVISGLGILGFITRIKYRLFYIGSDYKINVHVKNYDNIDDLEQKFDLRESVHIETLKDLKSQSSLFYFEGNKPKVALYERCYVPDNKKQYHFNRYLYIGALLTFIIRFFPKFANQIMINDEKKDRKGKTLLRGLEKVYYGTFWAEPDYIWMKYLSKLFSIFGYQPKLFQNSYFIPLGNDNVSRFTQTTCNLLLKYKLHFAMFDIMYIPKDEPFLLSASKEQEGFYINTTFFDKIDSRNLMEFYAELNDLCIEMNGKMNLVKNLFIRSALLEKMYSNEILELIALKKQTDPSNIIQSNFFYDKFPSFFVRP